MVLVLNRDQGARPGTRLVFQPRALLVLVSSCEPDLSGW